MFKPIEYTKISDMPKMINNKEVFTGNSCKLVKFTNKYIIYSYDTIIGVIIDNDIYISNKYYSSTTSKYTNILKSSKYNKIYVDDEMDLKIVLRRKSNE